MRRLPGLALDPLSSQRRGWGACRRCGARLARGGVCRRCGRRERLGAYDWIELVADPGSFQPLGKPGVVDPLGYRDSLPYRDCLAAARDATGLDESVVAGIAKVGGRPVCVIVFDFRFLGGSMGVAAGECVVTGLTTATELRLPAVMIVSSSGARLQEGLASLFQMARTTAAVAALRDAGLPLVAVLADPSTGAPVASCANQADLVLAERGALIAFAGPRAVKAVSGRGEEAFRAEELESRGLVDGTVDRGELRRTLIDALLVLKPGRAAPAKVERLQMPAPAPVADRWRLLRELRSVEQPSGVRWLDGLSTCTVLLRGDRTGADDPALVCALARIGGESALVLASDRLAGDGFIGASGYRKARRALTVAARLGLPVVSLVDGPGAEVGRAADGSGIAHALADCFAAMLEHPAPTIALVVGEASSGGALALASTDRIFMLERSTFAVIAPEAAAAILDRVDRSPREWADALEIAAADAYRHGLIDGVLPEPGGAGRLAWHRHLRRAKRLLEVELGRLRQLEPDELLRARRGRYLGLTRDLLGLPGAETRPVTGGGAA